MIYNQTRMNGVPMPLLMGCTKPSTIEVENDVNTIMYDPVTQIAIIDCRIVGTKSLKVHTTAGGHQDRKNEIDDKKNVK
jgi:hypothetical protein